MHPMMSPYRMFSPFGGRVGQPPPPFYHPSEQAASAAAAYPYMHPYFAMPPPPGSQMNSYLEHRYAARAAAYTAAYSADPRVAAYARSFLNEEAAAQAAFMYQ